VASVNEPLTEGGKSFASIIGESHLFRIASLKEEILAEEDFQICQKRRKFDNLPKNVAGNKQNPFDKIINACNFNFTVFQILIIKLLL
jgi:hypothetical protein